MEEVLSSRARLRIVDALSVRPRTLRELADIAGISMQGVIKHLRRLGELGLVEERSLSRAAPSARQVYAATALRISDFSGEGHVVVKRTLEPRQPSTKGKIRDLESASGDILVLRRRIMDETRKLGRMIDEAADEQVDLASAIGELPLSPAERLMLEVVLTEDTLEDGVKVLARYYGLADRKSIETAISKARRFVRK
jgi:predicted transcriptional regulator